MTSSTNPANRPSTPAAKGSSVSSVITLVLTVVVLVALVVFIVQNGEDTQVEFLNLDFTLPLGVNLLLAAVVGALLLALVSATRRLRSKVKR